ncbi:MAG TPA: prolyl oligopeptidase family serine peptidase, partial [Cyclobacteriaceae bacterium]|nr:prolyl oligopeptidase family serine peptidase [Cyclobacteriaceae bacterium]
MRHHFLIIGFILFTAGMANAQDLTSFKKENYISSTGLTLPYRILYPQHYDKTQKYPVVLFLHGAGERGNNNESQLVHGAKLFTDPENRKAYPAIVIFPQCPEDGYWASVEVNRNTSPFALGFDYTRPVTPALQAAIELVRKIIITEGVDKSRVYITGLSMGGMGTFEAVYRYPELFAAAAPICGGADVDAYDKRVSGIPFRVFHGAKDAVVDVKHSQAVVEKLKALQAHVEYTEYPEVNHNSWDNAFAEPDFLSWLFSKKR